MNLKDKIRVIPDFPKAGIRFKDITPLLKDKIAYRELIDEMAGGLKQYKVDLVIGPEARGFVIGAPLAYALHAGFVPIRKPGKLPCETVNFMYDLEYGKDSLEIHKDAIQPGQNIVIADDLLATGGTAAATIELVEKLGGHIVSICFAIELTYLNGRDNLKSYDVHSIIKF